MAAPQTLLCFVFFTLSNTCLSGGSAWCSCAADPCPPDIPQICSPEPPVIPTMPRPLLQPWHQPPLPSPGTLGRCSPGGDNGCLHGMMPWWRWTWRRGCSTLVLARSSLLRRKKVTGAGEAGRGALAPGPPDSPGWEHPGAGVGNVGCFAYLASGMARSSRRYTSLGTSFPCAAGYAGTMGNAGCLANARSWVSHLGVGA